MMPNPIITRTCAGLAIAFAIIAGLLWRQTNTLSSATVSTDLASSQPSITPPNITAKTLNDLWRRESPSAAVNESASTEELAAPSVQFDAVAIHAGLQQIRLDPMGNIIPDAVALDALQQAFQFGSLILDDASIAEFQDIIRVALPGPAGEQTATIVKNFNDYLRAKQDFLDLLKSAEQEIDPETTFETLVTLRRIHLGDAVANQLYEVEEATARHMMANLQLEGDGELSPEEKRAQQQALTDIYADAEIGIDNWSLRYQAFLQDRQAMEQAGYTAAELQQQLDDLKHYHFSEAELQRIGFLNLEGL